MAIAYGSGGTAGAGTTTASPTFPATVNPDDVLIVASVSKYPAALPTAPAGLAFDAAAVASGGAGAGGADSGQVTVAAMWRVADGSEDAFSFAVPLPSGNSIYIVPIRLTGKTAGLSADLAYASGSQNAQSVSWSVVMGSDPGIRAGDFLVVIAGMNGDVGAWSAETLSVPGCTVGTVTERVDAGTSQGDDCRLVICTAAVTAGASTGAATFTATISATTGTDCPAGAVLLIRIREVNAGASAAALGAVTGTAAGKVESHGAASATLGATTGSAAGSVETHGAASSTLGATTGAAAGTVETHGQGAATLGAVTGAAAGSVETHGAGAGALAEVAGAATGGVETHGAGTQDLGAVTGAATGTAETHGAGAVVLGAVTGDAAGSVETHGAGDVALGEIVGQATGTVTGVLEDLPAFVEFDTTLELDDQVLTLEVAEPAAGLELDLSVDGGAMYVIKEGDRLPGISGLIRVPAGIDLTGALLYMTYRGRAAPARTVLVVLDGLAEDSPAVDNAEGLPTVWAWHHDWAAGETTPADRYRIGVSADISGLQMTAPNAGWSEFVIQAQLVADPVPA